MSHSRKIEVKVSVDRLYLRVAIYIILLFTCTVASHLMRSYCMITSPILRSFLKYFSLPAPAAWKPEDVNTLTEAEHRHISRPSPSRSEDNVSNSPGKDLVVSVHNQYSSNQ